MFYCDDCGTLQAAGVKMHKVVKEVRSKAYFADQNKEEPIGHGHEIVREAKIGDCCVPKKVQ